MEPVLITDGMDVQRVALDVLLEREFVVWREPGANHWSAVWEGHMFQGATPLDVLGMVFIWDRRGRDWSPRPDEPDIAWEWGLEREDDS